ncbi:hypothetical protein C8Q70DRAFT_180151 [Cubamyces menziesii]|uniref:Uncharacterized protein n=1 Tax=Trametes cubensis TaxID=1111947 RepID=A0AAD7TJT8_9APHY|nr:hypothetical protein C8Q70DRAFT_180151 [Cubamyces menziesii]KAJ8463424.1 hypothetical protein ONZ51_g10266 [Trametes cubensis]
MLSKFSFFTKYPTAVILVEHPKSSQFIHVVPESGTVEGAHITPRITPFRVMHGREVSREAVGSFTYPEKDFSISRIFGDAASKRATELWNANMSSGDAVGDLRDRVALLVQNVLLPAAQDALKDLEGKAQATTNMVEASVFIVRMTRSKPEGFYARGYPVKSIGF